MLKSPESLFMDFILLSREESFASDTYDFYAILSFWRISISSLLNFCPEVRNDYFDLCSESELFSCNSLVSRRGLLCKLLRKADSILYSSLRFFYARCFRI